MVTPPCRETLTALLSASTILKYVFYPQGYIMITMGLLELQPSVLSSRQKTEVSSITSRDKSFYSFSAHCVYMHCLIHPHSRIMLPDNAYHSHFTGEGNEVY